MARTTDGPAPVSRQKNSSTGIASSDLSRRSPGSSRKPPMSSETWRPDTATRWRSPVRLSWSPTASESSSCSPVRRAIKRPPPSLGYSSLNRSCMTFAAARGRNRRGISSLGMTVSAVTLLLTAKMPRAV